MNRKLLALSATIALTTASQSALAETTIRLGHVTQESHPFHVGAEMLRDAVDEKSNGELVVDIFPARQLGDDAELLEGVQMGTVDAAVISSAVFSSVTPVMDALQLPFLIPDYDTLGDVLTSSVADEMLDSLNDVGLKGLGYYEGGLRHLLLRKEAVALSDMRGLNTRVVPSRLHLDTWEAIGVSPTPMAYGEIYTSLETGVLDATEINITSVYSEQLFEVANHMTLTAHYFWPAVVVVNPNFFANLSDEQRTMLKEAAQETIKPQVTEAGTMGKDARAELENSGVSFHELSDPSEMDDAVADVISEFSAKHPLIEAFVTEVEQHTEAN